MIRLKKLSTLVLALLTGFNLLAADLFPDGTPIPDWFRETRIASLSSLGKAYRITDYGVAQDSNRIQTKEIQAVIDLAAQNGGGVVVIPKGTFLSGSIFFKPKTHLHIEAGGTLKGSDDISNFEIRMTRIEGQTLKYFSALVNADGVDGFTISGKGTINGNGHRYWQSFWLRRSVIPKCTNMDELRPRLVFISNSNDVQLSGVSLINSPFWTTHLYKCNRVKLLGLHIFAPAKPVKAPSSDAIDIDVCTDVLVKNCYMSVNDDAVALKGGKGPWADKDPNNGGNFNIIIEDCTYGYCHSALTCGSESIHNRNIILRRIDVQEATRLLWLKMRPDTPQHYEYITVEDIKGNASNFLFIHPWSQFFDLKDREDMPMSHANNITMRNIQLECNTFFNVRKSDQYALKDFHFENLNIRAKNGSYDAALIENLVVKNVHIQTK
ncbi:MAG TPA: glycosyl hydrolase family 28 protein [Bacteroidales bacterium]|nr:glycosyl hydrolase family 28 protein [Bacteroidales bacterium]